MKVIAILTTILYVILHVNANCPPNEPCYKARGSIEQNGLSVSPAEVAIGQHRIWSIEPPNSRGTVLLAFKNFRSSENKSVEVYFYQRDGERETQTFNGKLGNFEILKVNVWRVVINVTLDLEENTNFTLQYYMDCEVAQENLIIYPDVATTESDLTTCYLITPQIHGYINRIYYTLRNVALPESMQLKMTDVHTSEIITVVENEKEYTSIAVESTATNGGLNSYYALVDLTCTSDRCDYSRARYTAAFYAMNERDIWCIEVQTLCRRNVPNVPEEWCNQSCPGLELMTEQEYILESNLLTTHVGENGNGLVTYHLKKLNRRLTCPRFFPPELCNCPRNPIYDGDFCNPKIKCRNQRGCTWRCIFTLVTRCVTIKRIAPVVLI